MYFYFLVAVLASCTSMVTADTCFNLNATFTVSPRICYPQYSISSTYAQNNTGGDQLATFFNSLASSHQLLNYSCAQAVADYYCEKFYPECDDGTSTSVCASTCNNVLAACASDIDKFTNILPLPTQTDCDALSATECSSTPDVNLTSFYTDCVAYNYSKLAIATYFVCTPDYLIPVGNTSYSSGDAIFDAFKYWQEDYEYAPDDWMYPCFKAWANFWCAEAFPECPINNAVPVLPVCASECTKVIDLCNETIAQYFNPEYGYEIPTEALCASLPDNTDVDCFLPPANSTSVAYFFGSDPPGKPLPPTPSPTPEPIIYITGDSIVYPPGGPGKGGGIGAAVLVGILALIGLLMLVMKKQDAR